MSKSEYNHAMIISSLLGNKLQLTANALFSKQQSITWTKIGWDSSNKNYQIAGLVYEKFFFTKLFFWFQHPNLYSLIDKLAFMYVLEKFQVNFYRVLSQSENYRKLGLLIEDEAEHTEKLLTELKKLTPNYQRIIIKWECRKILSILGIVLESVIIFIELLHS
ncbi:hypothetical protein FJR11_19685 [Anabaena sp. UHCC 0187]|nr:hypothetical protein [Anabaena sp. UHCC 0187]